MWLLIQCPWSMWNITRSLCSGVWMCVGLPWLFLLCVCVLVHARMHIRAFMCVWGGVYLSVLFPCVDPWLSLVWDTPPTHLKTCAPPVGDSNPFGSANSPIETKNPLPVPFREQKYLLVLLVGPCSWSGLVRVWRWVRQIAKGALKPTWKGLHMVILSTPVPVKVAGVTPWIHTRVKKVKVLNAASKLWTRGNLNLTHICPSTPWPSTSSWVLCFMGMNTGQGVTPPLSDLDWKGRKALTRASTDQQPLSQLTFTC